MNSIAGLADIQPTSPIGRAWAHFADMLKEASRTSAAYDTARDNSMDACIMDFDLSLEQAMADNGVEATHQAMNRFSANLAEARVALIAAYRAEFGDPGVQRLEVFLSALQKYGEVHPMLMVGSFNHRHPVSGPAAIRIAGDELAGLWI